MDHAKFFESLRRSKLFNNRLTQNQVNGIQSILDAGDGFYIQEVAYGLATAYHETGRSMAPNRESLNYSPAGLIANFRRHRISEFDANRLGRITNRPADQRGIANIIYGGVWGREQLGNTEPDDGWKFRGGGQAHVTGRRNYLLVGKVCGADLITNPDLILDPIISAKALMVGSNEGWYTNYKFSDFKLGDYFSYRKIINGLDDAELIAGYAKVFEGALRRAGCGAIHHKVDQIDVSPVKKVSLVGNLFGLMIYLLKRFVMRK